MPFRFRQFTIDDDRSTMPVGTDSMLLGAWTDPRKAARILDLGTGCGVLALMLAQRSEAPVLAIDIDPDSVAQAKENFARSPWSSRLSAECISAAGLALTAPGTFDLVVSNPPFFSRSLRSPEHRKNLARHDEGLTREQLADALGPLLSPEGECSLVLPYGDLRCFSELAADRGLYVQASLRVRSFANTPPIRVLARFSKIQAICTETKELIIFEGPGKFSGEYLQLTSGYHYF